jgi:hypothetical protein
MQKWARAFSIDYRSLRFMRAAVGVMTLLHALLLMRDLPDLLTDEGIAPYDLLTSGGSNPFVFSFFYFSHGPGMAWAHLILLMLCGLGLVYNRGPRLAAFAGYALLISLNNRMAHSVYGVDALLTMTYLWLSFLPPARPESETRSYFTSLAGIAILLQITYLYVFAGFVKSHDYYFTQGAGAYAALKADLYSRPTGLWLAEAVPYPVLQFLSRAVLVWERYGPLLIFSPWWPAACRTLVFAGFAFMHLAFASTMAIGIFPGVDIALLIVLLPGEVWEKFLAFKPLRNLPALKTWRRDYPPLDGFAPVIIAGLFCVTVWNIKHLEYQVWVPQYVRWAAKNLSLNQGWGMFAPSPFSNDGWFVIQGTSVQGLPVDVLRGTNGFADFRKPRIVSAMFPSARWIPNSVALFGRQSEPQRHAWADYFCRKWEARGRPLKELRLWFVAESTVPHGEVQPIYSTLLLSRDCDGTSTAPLSARSR